MKTSELDPQEVGEKVLELGRTEAAKYFKVNNSTFRDFLYREGLPTRKARQEKAEAKLTIKPDSAEVTTAPTEGDLESNEQIVISRGLNPDEWEFTGMVDSEWDSPTGETLRSRKITLARKKPGTFIGPARTDGPTWKAPKAKKIGKDGALFFVGGDDQAPFHDPYLEEKKLLFLEDNNFHTIIKIGDTMDFPNISRYKKNPEVEEIATVNNCVTSGYEIIRKERIAAPDARIVKLIGNHDVRLRDFILNTVPELHGLRRAQIEGQNEASVFSPTFLLRLDELGVELVGDNENYEHGEVKISKYLAARHGWYARKGAGSSALTTLDHLLYSVLVGHTHRLALVHKTIHNIDGDLTTLVAGETGCLCSVDKKGLGYTPSPDWQQGAATVEVWPDGKFHVDLVNFLDGDLIWRGNRY
jgi:hypothetical protein